MKIIKSKTKRKIFFDFNSLLIISFILLFAPIESNENCGRDIPILKESQCYLLYCSKDQFDSGECQINNTIIKTQWLNNFINIKISFTRYVSFASYSNGDMILQAGTYPKSKKRFFLGFKKNGRCFFIDEQTNKPTYFHSFEVNQDDSFGKYESENIAIKMKNSSNEIEEFLFSISKKVSYVEIYDFKNDIIYQKILNNFSNNETITSFQHVIIPLFTSSTDFSYIFGFIKNDEENPYTFIFQKHTFNSIENFENENSFISTFFYRRSIFFDQTGFSCFLTENRIIICFFLTFDIEYIISAFDVDLNEKKSIPLPYSPVKFNQTFYKCIHLKNEIGAFIYFKNYENQNPNFYPVILFKEYQETDSEINIIDYEIPEIIINKIRVLYDPYILTNDIIKLNENKLCFCSANNINKNTLYIILINLFEEQKYKVRYYLINLKELYGYSVHYHLKAYNYNNFLALAFSFKSLYIEECNASDNSDKVCTTLLIFSYPNSTDSELILDDYFRNNLTLNDIEINLENEVRIENNIFGYEFLGIEIKDLVNCENLIIMTTLSHNISLNYNLHKNELIKLKFSGIDYKAFICNLQYNYKVTEPDLDIYDIYPYIFDEFNETNIDPDFIKKEYTGRLTYFDIKLDEDLTTNCNDSLNCAYCFESNKNVCLECKYNFTFFADGTRNCSDKEEEVEVEETTINTFFSEYTTNIFSSYYYSTEIESSLISSAITENKYTDNYDNYSTEIESTLIASTISENIYTDNYDNYSNEIKSSLVASNTENIYSEHIIMSGDVEIIKREIKESKEELVENLKSLMDTVEIGKNYEMEGEDFTIIIKPTNTSIPSATHVDFSACENILREHYKIDDSRIITFFQLELNDKNEKSLVNQIGYQAYDDKKNPLNLSLCNDTNIQVFYLIKSNSSLDLSSVSSFKDSNVDIFNIQDDFFNDICTSYSDYSGNDVILEDRVNDIYQNYSLCEEGCTYNESNLELMIITCDCKVKENLTTNLTEMTLVQKDELETSSPFEIIKCYQLVFSGKNKSKNVGFIVFTFLFLLHIPFLFLYFYRGIKPIKEYLSKEMLEKGYLKKILEKMKNRMKMK